MAVVPKCYLKLQARSMTARGHTCELIGRNVYL